MEWDDAGSVAAAAGRYVVCKLQHKLQLLEQRADTRREKKEGKKRAAQLQRHT